MRAAVDAFYAVASAVLGVLSGVTAFVVTVGWVVGGDDALGIHGAWTHLVAVAAFYACMAVCFADAARTVDKYRDRP